MGMFEWLPYTNFHELNLDYLLREMKRLREDYERFKAEMQAKIDDFISRAEELLARVQEKQEELEAMIRQLNDEWNTFKAEIEELVNGWNSRITALEASMADTVTLVEQMRAEVSEMRISVNNHETRITVIETAMSAINTDIASLQNAVEGLEIRVAAVEEIVSGLMQYVLTTMVPVSDIVDSVTFGPVGGPSPVTACELWNDGDYSAYSAYTPAETDVYKILSFNLIATMPFEGEPYLMMGGREYELVVTLKNRYRLFDVPLKMRGCVAKVDMLDDNQQITQERYLTAGGAAAYSLFALNNGNVEGDDIYSRTLRYKISPPANNFGIFGILRFTITDLTVIEDYDPE